MNEKIIEVVELATDIGNEILEEVKNKEKFFYKDDIYFFVYPDDNGSFKLKFLEKIQEMNLKFFFLIKQMK